MVFIGFKKSQGGAIRKSIELGLILQRDLPEIAEDARNGKTRSWIVDNYDIVNRYSQFTEGHLTAGVAKQGVYYAENGHEGGFGIPPYKGLIDREEKKRISGKYLVEFHRRAGNRSLELKVGVHGRTTEQRREDIRKSIFAKGETPWEQKEIEDARSFSQSPEYYFQEGPYMGRINIGLIAEKLNEKYHSGESIRTKNSVISILYKLRKQKKKQKRKEEAKPSSQ
ncbi:hypothetical protein J4422_04645 [Candidatus Pacearchaeota archaeon]|nr:hypothetical protein [Candidatus Pacearchaeota archaeon]